eukprot:378801-Prorocentrum_minimum.AAC.1
MRSWWSALLVEVQSWWSASVRQSRLHHSAVPLVLYLCDTGGWVLPRGVFLERVGFLATDPPWLTVCERPLSAVPRLWLSVVPRLCLDCA